MKKFSISFLVLSILTLFVLLPQSIAQELESNRVDMADTFRSEGKIYVVVLVVAIVFTGLIIYAINTDRKLSKVEKEIQSLKSKKDS